MLPLHLLPLRPPLYRAPLALALLCMLAAEPACAGPTLLIPLPAPHSAARPRELRRPVRTLRARLAALLRRERIMVTLPDIPAGSEQEAALLRAFGRPALRMAGAERNRTAGDTFDLLGARRLQTVEAWRQAGQSGRFTGWMEEPAFGEEGFYRREGQELTLESTGENGSSIFRFHRLLQAGRGRGEESGLSFTDRRLLGAGARLESLLSIRSADGWGSQLDASTSFRQPLARFGEARASLRVREAGAAGSGIAAGLGLSAAAGPVDGRLDWQMGRGSSGEAAMAGAGRLAARLGRHLDLQGDYSLLAAPGRGPSQAGRLQAEVRPVPAVTLRGASMAAAGAGSGVRRGNLLQVSVDPDENIGFETAFEQQQSDREGESSIWAWQVWAGREKQISLQGEKSSYFFIPDGARLLNEFHQIELRPSPRLAVVGSIRSVAGAEGVRTVQSAGARLSPVPALELSGAVRRPHNPGGPSTEPSGHDAGLRLNLGNGLSLFGRYSLFPEDQYGYLRSREQQSTGAEVRLGSLSLIGARTRETGADTLAPGARSDLMLAVRPISSTELFFGISRLDQEGFAAHRLQLYRLGVRSSAGARFILSLEGEMGRREVAGASSWDGSTARANARLGLRF